MTTHVSYELGLPNYTTDRDVIRLITELRSHALASNARDVTPLWRLSGRELLLESPWRWPTLRLRYLTARGFIETQDAHLPLDIAGFFLRPGRQSEMAILAVFRRGSAETTEHSESRESRADWYWDYECQTMTADAEAALLRLLHRARQIGFAVTVH